MSYNLSIIADNATSIAGFSQGINNVLLDGWLGILILLGLCAVVFLSLLFSTNDGAKAITATSFLGMVVSIFLRALSLMSNKIMMICILVCALAVALAWSQEK